MRNPNGPSIEDVDVMADAEHDKAVEYFEDQLQATVTALRELIALPDSDPRSLLAQDKYSSARWKLVNMYSRAALRVQGQR